MTSYWSAHLWPAGLWGKTTWGDLVVMCGRPVRQHVFDLKELVWPVSSDDGEPKALGAFSKCRLQDGALQLRRISREAPQPPARLLCCRDNGGTRGERLTSGNEQGNGAKYLKWLNYLNYHVLNHFLLFTRLSLLDSVSLTINREMYNSAFILNLKWSHSGINSRDERSTSLKFTGLRAVNVHVVREPAWKWTCDMKRKLQSLLMNCHLPSSLRHSHGDNVSDGTSLTASNYMNTLRAS